MNTTRRFGLAVVVLLAGAAGQAKADQIINSLTGLASPAETITFSEHVFAPGTLITTQYQDLGVTFSPNLFYSPQVFPAPHIDNMNLGNFNPTVSPFTINFTQNQTSAAFAMITNPGTSKFEALENGVVISSFNASTDTTSPGNFFGFANLTFNAIRVTPGGGNSAMLLDNLQLGTARIAVPEPSTIALACTALPVGLILARRRRKAKLAA